MLLLREAAQALGGPLPFRMASEGATIALLGRRLNPLQDTLAEVKALGGSGHALSCDIQNQHAVDQAFDEIASTLGPIDYMVANAGIGGPMNLDLRIVLTPSYKPMSLEHITRCEQHSAI